MKVGKFQIGRYHAIIKKEYEDGSVGYETSFSDRADLMGSVYAIRSCIGERIGTITKNPKVLKNMCVIYGRDNIIKELEGKEPFDFELE